MLTRFMNKQNKIKMNSTRTYEKIETIRGRRYKSLRKGLKKVNIGEDVWLCGKQNHLTKPGDSRPSYHMVIYGPNRKEYHVWGQDVYDICTDINEWGEKDYSNCNRHGNSAIHNKLKIYILTHILDDKTNW